MKNIKALVGGLALAAIVGVNGYMSIGSGVSISELTLDGMESMAEGEHPDAIVVYLWIEEIPEIIEYHNFVRRRQVETCYETLSRKSSNCAYKGQWREMTIDIY